MTDPKNHLFEFDGFRVDPVRRRLSRGDELVALTPKAVSILLVLLDRRGQVVPKDELIQQVWPDTFVTEANVTQNVFSLRKALGERANDPRYVITVPGQGYSFVGDVLMVPRDATGEMPAFRPLSTPARGTAVPADLAAAVESPSAGIEGTAAEAVSAALETAGSRISAAPRRSRQRRLLWALAAVLAVAVAAASFYYLGERAGTSGAGGTPATTAKPDRAAVAVLGFTNLSGNPDRAWLATALTEMLTTDLASGGKVRLISAENVTRARAALALPDAANLRSEELTRLRNVLGADLIVLGSYLALGEQAGGKIRLDVQVIRVPSGDLVASVAQIGTEKDPFDLVSRTALEVRHVLGWATPSAAQLKETEALRPASPEAARFYAEGLARLRAFDPHGATDLLTQAAEADPKLAVIHSALAQAWTDLGYDARAASEAEKAVHLSAPLAKEEQLAIQARFFESKWEWNKASGIYRSLWTFFPDDLEYGLRLAHTLTEAGRSAEALEAVAALRRLPKRDDPRIDLAEARLARKMWDPKRGLAAAEAAAIKGWKQGDGQSQVVAQALALQGQAHQIMGDLDPAVDLFRQAQKLFAKSGNQAQVGRMLTMIGEVLDDQGQLALASQQFEAALAIFRQLGSEQLAASEYAHLAVVRLESGELAEARDLLQRADALYPVTENPFLALRTGFFLGQALAAQGDFEAARLRYEKVLTSSRELGVAINEAVALEGLAQLLAIHGQLGDAGRNLRQALAIATKANDPYRQAQIQTSQAEVLARQGSLKEAQRLFETTLATWRQLGSRLNAAQVQGGLAALAFRSGDLAGARAKSFEQVKVAQGIGAQLVAADGLRNLVQVEIAEGDLAGARGHLEEALRIASRLGAEPRAAAIRLDLARLELESDQVAESIRLAREAAEWFGRHGAPGQQAHALAVLAESLARQGAPALAREPAEKARALVEHSEDGELRVMVTTSLARVEASLGGRGTESALLAAVEQAGREGYVAAGLDARLVLGAAQKNAGKANPGASGRGRSLLEKVQREALQRGFKLLAQRAEQLLAASGQRLG